MTTTFVSAATLLALGSGTPKPSTDATSRLSSSIAAAEVRIGPIRRQRLCLLHVRERLRKVVRLTEDVVVPQGGMRHVQLGRELQGLRDRSTRVLVLVQANLGSGKSEPGTRTLGVLLDQLLPQRQLTRQVVVEPFSGHPDLEPLRVRRAGRVLLG